MPLAVFISFDELAVEGYHEFVGGPMPSKASSPRHEPRSQSAPARSCIVPTLGRSIDEDPAPQFNAN